jgi:hypothetical protein
MSTIKKNLVWLLFAFALILFVVKFFPDKLNKSSQTYYKTVQINGGWGYDIYKNDSIYIHQMSIPALEGATHFKSESDAKKVAILVIEKIKYHQFPTITLEELDSLKIQ